MPDFVPASGPFLGRRGAILGDPGPEPGHRAALGAHYAALVVDVMLDKLAVGGPIVIEGDFHRNAPFCRLLAALRTGQRVHVSADPSAPRAAPGCWRAGASSRAGPTPCLPQPSPGGLRASLAIAPGGAI